MPAGKTRLSPLHVALCAVILAGVSWAAAPVRPAQPTSSLSGLRRLDCGARQPAKVASFAGGNGADVRKKAAGQFFQLTRLAVWPQGAVSPTFNLVDAEGVPRTLSDYRGHVVVIFFGFLHCPDVCPAELLKLALVMKQLGQVAEHVQVLFITLDPQRDTPALLKSYVSAFDPRFIGLTGTTAQVDQAASSFNVQYARVPLGNDYTIDHSTACFVLDAAGHLRLIGGADSSVADFVHDIAALAAEPPGRS